MPRVHPTAPLLAASTRVYPDTICNMQSQPNNLKPKRLLVQDHYSKSLSHPKQKTIKPEKHARTSIDLQFEIPLKREQSIDSLSATNRKIIKPEILPVLPSATLDFRIPRRYHFMNANPKTSNQNSMWKTSQVKTKTKSGIQNKNQTKQ